MAVFQPPFEDGAPVIIPTRHEDGLIRGRHLAPDAGVKVSQLENPAWIDSRYISISDAQLTTASPYNLLSTPDRIDNVRVPVGGLLYVWYWAEWKNETASDGRAAIFLGSNQLKVVDTASAAPIGQNISGNSTADTYRPMTTIGGGLTNTSSATAYTGNVTTGMAFATSNNGTGCAPCVVAFHGVEFSGSVSVRFGSAAGTDDVTVKNRELAIAVFAPARA